MDDHHAKTVREIRINPIVPSESVLVATARGMRPRDDEAPAPRDTRKHVETCPFCRGNEHMTPPAVLATPSEPEWDVRVVENLYPVLGGSDGQSNNFSFGLQHAIDGYGRHEVLIDHANHGIALQEMSEDHLARLFNVYRERMQALYENPRIRYVLAFKNYGPAAGASIRHTHSQVIAMPVVPQNVHDEVENSANYWRKHHHCIFCSLIDEALTFEATLYDRSSGEIRRQINVGQYVVERGERFIAIKPFASRFEWEVHILPLEHQADFTRVTAEDLADLARVLRRTMGRLDAVLGGAQYNYFLHSLPRCEDEKECQNSYHWHLEIVPRTSIPSGFELGSGLFVNTISPEDAAERLRQVKLELGPGE